MKDIRRKTKKLLVLVFLFSFTSCETLVNNVPPDKLPFLEEKLVINSFISPQDTLVKVYVGLSSPLFAESKSVNRSFSIFDGDTTIFGNTPFISDAEVFMKSGDIEVKLNYDPVGEYYFFRPSSQTLRIFPSRDYTLLVRHEGKTATAETTVPNLSVLDFNVEIDTTIVLVSRSIAGESYFDGYSRAISNISTTIIGGGYFRFRGSAAGVAGRVESNSEGEYETIMFDSFLNAFFEDAGIIDLSSQNDVSRLRGQGLAIISNLTTFANGEVFAPNKFPVITSVYNEVMRVTESYYLYYESLQNFNDGNPFVEPTPVYSNIEGGLGIFASSDRVGERVEFDPIIEVVSEPNIHH